MIVRTGDIVMVKTSLLIHCCRFSMVEIGENSEMNQMI